MPLRIDLRGRHQPAPGAQDLERRGLAGAAPADQAVEAIGKVELGASEKATRDVGLQQCVMTRGLLDTRNHVATVAGTTILSNSQPPTGRRSCPCGRSA